jgi:hypothetical protein
MKSFFLRPRSILGAVLWGAASAILVFAAILIIDFAVSLYRGSFGSTHHLSSVSLGNGFSVDFEATPAHPFLAEYDQKLVVYKNTPRDGDIAGRIEVPMNTGGRVRILLFVPRDPSVRKVALSDRHVTSIIDLESLSAVPGSQALVAAEWIPLGLLSGESPPLKFIPCSLWSRMSNEEKTAIMAGSSSVDACAWVAP